MSRYILNQLSRSEHNRLIYLYGLKDEAEIRPSKGKLDAFRELRNEIIIVHFDMFDSGFCIVINRIL